MPETGNNSRIPVQVGPDGKISFFTYKCTLVPKPFFSEAAAPCLLSAVAELSENDRVAYVEVPQYDAVLVYADMVGSSAMPEMYYILSTLYSLGDYNKIVASYCGGRLYLAVAQGKSLLLCNSFAAPDFTTAEYFLLLAVKRLQLNPEVSTVYFRTSLTQEQELSLYEYFRSVESV